MKGFTWKKKEFYVYVCIFIMHTHIHKYYLNFI
jgi:hypothetical protein